MLKLKDYQFKAIKDYQLKSNTGVEGLILQKYTDFDVHVS